MSGSPLSKPTQEHAPPPREVEVVDTLRSGQGLCAALLLAVGVLAFALQLRYVWPFTADDAFITFRYAANWVAGHGPNFNADGPRSEGVTSFGFLLICLIPHALGIDAVLFAKWLGVACALGTALLAAQLARDLDGCVRGASREDAQGAAANSAGSPLAAAFAAFLFLGFYPTAIHAASGMETLLGAGLLTALVRVHVRRSRGLPGARYALGVLSLALGLVRPELNIVAGLLLALALLRASGPRRAALARDAALSYLLPGALFFASRAAYYGHLFPIPYYAKLAGSALFPAATGVLVFLQNLLGIVALFAVLPIAIAPGALAPAWLAIGAVVVLGLLPDPVMDFDFRYCMPAVPSAFAIAGAGFACLVRLCAHRPAGLRPRGGAVAALLTLATIVFLGARALDPAIVGLRERRAYGQALADMNVRLGRVLADYRPGSGRAPVLAIGDAGAIPYYSGLRVIDTFSLNDPGIAIDGHHEPEYVLDQDPDLVGVVSEQAREFHAHRANRHDPGLFDACRARGWRPAVILTFSARSFLWLMAEPESDIERYLQRVYLDRSPPGSRPGR